MKTILLLGGPNHGEHTQVKDAPPKLELKGGTYRKVRTIGGQAKYLTYLYLHESVPSDSDAPISVPTKIMLTYTPSLDLVNVALRGEA